MMRIAYIGGTATNKSIVKARKQTAKQLFLAEVEDLLADRAIFDEQKANEKFTEEKAELQRLRIELKSLKTQRDAIHGFARSNSKQAKCCGSE